MSTNTEVAEAEQPNVTVEHEERAADTRLCGSWDAVISLESGCP